MQSHEKSDTAVNRRDEESVSEFIQSLKGLMLDGVIHEFRNIFSIVTGYTEMLIDGFGEGDSVIVSEVREEYSEIIKGCKRGKELLDKVTLMTRRSEVYPAIITSDALINEAVIFSKFFIPKNVQYEIEAENVGGKVLIDVIKFQQLVLFITLNILNVFEYKTSFKHLIFKALEIRKKDGSESLILDIYILDGANRFKQDESAIYNELRKVKTAGVDCHFASYTTMAKDLGIVVEKIDRGEAVGLRLEIPINITQIQIDKPKYRGPRKGNGQLILVVDDEESVAEVTARRLQKLGYQTLVRTNPKEAADLIKNREQPIDLLLTDQIMPEMTGLQLVEITKEYREDLKVIMVTGYASGITSEICRKYGISSMAMKPLTEGELAQLVENQFN